MPELTLPNLQYNVPLAPYTTFKIGGPAKYFVVVTTTEELQQAIRAAEADQIAWVVLGGGSDVLVADTGFNGLVIKLELRDVHFDRTTDQVTAGAGVLINALIGQCVKHEYSGLEYAIGVPATVGGAVWANLGARGIEIKDRLVSARVLNANGQLQTFDAVACQFGYRDSIFKHQKLVVVDATFQLRPVAKAELKIIVKELADLRRDTQDISAQCAGCVFKNPLDQTATPAAKLIDDLGLKGKQIGGAKISERHANFIINTGNATAEDVITLISYVKQQVRDKTGVQLMEEIEYIGF